MALGFAAAWPVVVQVFEASWSVDWTGALALIAGAAVLAAGGGLSRPSQALGQAAGANVARRLRSPLSGMNWR